MMDLAVVWIPPKETRIHFDTHPIPNTFAKRNRERLVTCLKNNPDRKVRLFVLGCEFTEFHRQCLNRWTEDYPNLEIVYIEKMMFEEYDYLKIDNGEALVPFSSYLHKDRNRGISLRNEVDVLKLLVLLTVTRPTALYEFDMLPQHCVADPPISNAYDIVFASFDTELTSHVIAVKGGHNPLLKQVHSYLRYKVLLNSKTPRNFMESLYMYALYRFEEMSTAEFVPSFRIIMHDPEFRKRVVAPGKFTYRDGVPLTFDFEGSTRMSENLYEIELRERAERHEYICTKDLKTKLANELMPAKFARPEFDSDFLDKRRFANAVRRIYAVLESLEFPDDTKTVFRQHLEDVVVKHLKAIEYYDVVFEIFEVLFLLVGKRDIDYVTRLLFLMRPDDSFHDGRACWRYCEFFFHKMGISVSSDLLVIIIKLTALGNNSVFLDAAMKSVCDLFCNVMKLDFDAVECLVRDVREAFGFEKEE